MSEQGPQEATRADPPADSVAPPGASVAPPGASEVPDSPVGETIPLDADDTRGEHFRRLVLGRGPLIATALFAVGAGAVGLLAIGPGVGAAAAGVAILIVLGIAFAIASSRAESDFFKAYAHGHSLTLQEGKTPVPPMTPLLRRGDRRYTKRRLAGTLPGDQPGTLAHYTYEDSTRDSDGNESTTYMHFTVVLAELPEVAPFMQELYAQRRSGFRFLDGAEDMFRKRQRVEHESESVDRRYEIFCGRHDDLNRARQILSPSFLVWLDENSPEGMAFECVAGMLVCNVKGHMKSKAELDSFCEGASGIARRLREEALE